MSDALDQGITVTKIQAMDEPVGVAAHSVAAFVGGALRGPLNTPVPIENFAAFTQRFGGIWPRSSLGLAVQQFFEHGGQRLFVVRVSNNARGALLSLPAGDGLLRLRALEPGSTEKIRAAVDYDGCDEDSLFNLTVQRIRSDSGLVADQEIYRRVSRDTDHQRYVADVLLESSIVRLELPPPAERPEPTMEAGGASALGYAEQTERGTDGDVLSDYDLVGSSANQTGIFALAGVERFDLLYLPPGGRGVDLGPAAVLAAERYARERGAMLVLDPPAEWLSVSDAVEGVRASGYASANMLSYFPRMLERGEESAGAKPVGGAIAGLLCRLDAQRGPWEDLDQPGFALQRRWKPVLSVSAEDGAALVKEGLNTIAGNSAGRSLVCGSVTLARNSELQRHFSSLTARRLCLAIAANVGRATRWAVFEAGGPKIAEQVRGQVHAYLTALADVGAFADGVFELQCESTEHQSPLDPQRGVNILLGFRPIDSDETVWLTLHQTVQGLRLTSTAFAPNSAECA